jgi:hypothetical protein
MVCSPSTTSPGNGSSEWLSKLSTSMGASIRVSVRLLVAQQWLMSRTRARVARARVKEARGTTAAPQLRGPSSARPTLRWPLALQATAGSATSLGGEKTTSAKGRRSIRRKSTRQAASKPNNPIRARWDQNSVTAAGACLRGSGNSRARFRRDASVYISSRTVSFPREANFFVFYIFLDGQSS